MVGRMVNNNNLKVNLCR